MSTFGDLMILGATILATVLLIYRMKNSFDLALPGTKKTGENGRADGKNRCSLDPWDDEIEYEPGLRAVTARKTSNRRRKPSRKYCKQVLKNMADLEKA